MNGGLHQPWAMMVRRLLLWCVQPACVSQQLVQSGRVTGSIKLSGGRKLKERWEVAKAR